MYLRRINKSFFLLSQNTHLNYKATIKLLLFSCSGYNGWFPVNIPVRGWASEEPDPAGHQQDENGLNRVGGGIEINVKFVNFQ